MASNKSTLALRPKEVPAKPGEVPGKRAPATCRFFTTSELVLQTLTYLPTPSLITCMRVNRDFHAKISEGSEFKETLFLEPATPIAYYNYWDGRRKKDRGRPPKLRKNPPTAAPYITTSHFDDDGRFAAIGTPNPLFAEQDHWIQAPPNISMRFNMDARAFLNHHDRQAQTPQGRIWNQMFICQPPTKHVQLRFTISFENRNGNAEMLYFHDPDYHNCWIDRREGVRIVDVVNEMHTMISRALRIWKGKNAYIVKNSHLELKLREVVDEFCPVVQEAHGANMMRGIKQGDDLVPVWTDQRREVREPDDRDTDEQ